MTDGRSAASDDDEPAFPELRGGGIALAVVGGIAASAAVPLLLIVLPLAVVWVGIAAILAGAAVKRGVHVVTTTVAAIVLPFVTPMLATCLSGYWGFLAPLLVILGGLVLLVTPLGFGIGRLVRARLAGAYALIRGILVVGASLGLIGWGILIADALNPGSCPVAP
jgi:hypothetical protein